MVVLNWNQSARTIRCLESVSVALGHTNDPVEAQLVVVDNNSLPQEQQVLSSWVESAPLDAKLVLNRENLGFSRGMNRGLELLERGDCDFVLLLNNDLTLAPAALQQFLTGARNNPSAAILSPTVVNPQTHTVVTCGGYRYYAPLGLALARGRGLSEESALRYQPGRAMDYPDGCALWLKWSFLEEVGGLPEQTFMYFEELRLARLVQGNGKMAWCPGAVVYHAVGGSILNAELRHLTTYRSTHAALNYTNETYPNWLLSVLAARLVAATMRTVRWRQIGYLRAALRAARDFFGSP